MLRNQYVNRRPRTGGWHRLIDWETALAYAAVCLGIGFVVYLGVRVAFGLALLVLEVAR